MNSGFASRPIRGTINKNYSPFGGLFLFKVCLAMLLYVSLKLADLPDQIRFEFSRVHLGRPDVCLLIHHLELWFNAFSVAFLSRP